MAEMWKAAVVDAFFRFSEKVGRLLPNLLAMVSVIVLGLVVAWALRVIISRVLAAAGFDNLCHRWGFDVALARAGLRCRPSFWLARAAYWVIVFFSLIIGVGALELEAVAGLLSTVFAYIPRVLAALIIVAAAYLVANFLGRAVLLAAVNAQVKSARLVSRSVRGFVIVIGSTMALVQLGIGKEVVVAAFSIVLGGAVLALALAFGLAGKDMARDFLQRRFSSPGERDLEEKKDEISHL